MRDELREELRQRGTAEISNGVVTQMTQALDEQSDTVKYSIFGEIKEQRIISIEEACAKCTSPSKEELGGIKSCQEFQKKDGECRGFHKLICPHQLID